MNIREEFLTRQFKAYLDRKTMPRGFESKPAARDAELQALVRCLLKFAPKDRFQDWWPIFEDRLSEDARTRAWPSGNEIKAAALSIRPTQSKTVAQGTEVDLAEINAERIQRGEPVGEGWLWGRLAVELLESGRVNLEQIRPYRSSIYFNEKKFYGEEAARENERDRERRHSEAEKVWAQSREPRNVEIPDIRSPYAREAAE